MKPLNKRLLLMIVFLIAVAVVLPTAFFGIPEASDLQQHFRFANVYYHSLTTNDAFPNWSADENFGYGDVGFRFYPPLEYYFLAIVRIIVGNWFDAVWLNFIFWMILGCAGIYYWSRCWLSESDSAIAAIVYVLIPSHLNQLYMLYNSYAEFAASSLLTFCFAFLTRIFQRNKVSDVIGLAFFYTLLILTHLPLTIIGSLSLLVYAMAFLRKDNFIQSLIKCSVAVVIALAASAFYWVRMISEMNLINHVSEKFSSGRFGFDEGFFPVYLHTTQFKDTIWIDYGAILTLMFLASPIIWFFYKKRNKDEIIGTKNIYQTVLPLGLIAFLMFTPFSRPIWQILTPLQKVQFPVRWMPIVSMCAAIVAAQSIHFLIKGKFYKSRIWANLCLIFLSTVIFYNLVYNLLPTAFAPYSRDRFEQTVRDLPETATFDCWWTIWAKENAFKIKEKVLIENRQVKILAWESEKRVFEVEAGNTATARLATFYYPLWQATVNGKKVEIEKDENGAMLIPIGNQHSKVELDFQEPQTVKFASKLSIFTLVLIIIAGLILLRKNRFFSFKRR